MACTTERGPDVLVILRTDHARFRRELASLVNGRDAAERRRRFFLLARQVVQHDVAERQTVYPALRADQYGASWTSLGEQELVACLLRVRRRVTLRPGGSKTSRMLQQLQVEMERHLRAEEQRMFPVLEARLSLTKREIMGTWFLRTAALAPTRPHPHAPKRWLAALTFCLVCSVVDRVRDRLRVCLFETVVDATAE